MYSASRAVLVAALAPLVLLGAGSASALRVCADPNNLPYSNANGVGYEIDLAHIAGRELGRPVQFVWTPERGGFLEKTLSEGRCDVVMSLPSGSQEVSATRPYYRSSYVFVSRRGGVHVHSFDDPALRKARVGVQVLQYEDAVVPPAQALLDRGLARNIVWYKIYPNFQRANPAAALIEGVEHGDIDVAIAWGPLAGYFAQRAPTPLQVIPVSPQFEHSIPFTFEISMGVRHGDQKLLASLNSVIGRRQAEIRRLLRKYGIPVLDPASGPGPRISASVAPHARKLIAGDQ